MPKGIYKRTPEMKIGKYVRTKEIKQRRMVPRETRICPCGETFICKVTSEQKFCKRGHWNTGLTKETDERVRGQAEKRSGKNNSNWIDGRSLKQNHCIDCSKDIGCYSKRCKVCANSGRRSPGFGRTPTYKYTKYKDTYMRSTWEVAFARWLDERKTQWEYEPRTFDLKYMTYTPDFYLPDINEYVEIKGRKTKKFDAKLSRFKKVFKDISITLLYGDDLKLLNVL